MQRDDKPLPRDDATRTVSRAVMAPLGACVRVHGAPSSPEILRLGAAGAVIGAGAGADMIIGHDTVSRRHLEVTLLPQGVAVVDLGSRNGTFFLGQRVERMTLALGSRIRVGSVELSIEVDTASLPTSASGELRYGDLLGASIAMRKLFAVLERLEGSLVTVLVEGESGVGKELVARALHERSMVVNGPLVVVNCGALDRELVRSELFGHKKGAFTGATEDRAGAFESADGGTLFLDEIGELPGSVQPVLLRALESGEVQRVGEDATRRVQVRVVAATNRDLDRDVTSGGFREDLYYRLAVVKLTVPPLRGRRQDVPQLATHFAERAGVRELPEDILARLAAYDWPGNVRELKNAVLAYLAIGALPDALGAVAAAAPLAALIDLALEQTLDAGRPYQEQRDELLGRMTRVYFRMLLARTGGNQSEAARISGVDRSYLRRLLSKYDVE